MVEMMDDEEDEDDFVPGRGQEGIHQLRHLLEQALCGGKWFLWFPNGGDDVTDDDGDVGSGDDLEDLGDNDQTNLTVVRRVLAALEQPLEPFQTIINHFARIFIFTNVALFCQKKKAIYKPALQVIFGSHFLLLVF